MLTLTRSDKGLRCFSLIGTVYITNTLAIMTANPAQYQSVAYNGTLLWHPESTAL